MAEKHPVNKIREGLEIKYQHPGETRHAKQWEKTKVLVREESGSATEKGYEDNDLTGRLDEPEKGRREKGKLESRRNCLRELGPKGGQKERGSRRPEVMKSSPVKTMRDGGGKNGNSQRQEHSPSWER